MKWIALAIVFGSLVIGGALAYSAQENAKSERLKAKTARETAQIEAHARKCAANNTNDNMFDNC